MEKKVSEKEIKEMYRDVLEQLNCYCEGGELAGLRKLELLLDAHTPPKNLIREIYRTISVFACDGCERKMKEFAQKLQEKFEIKYIGNRRER